MARKKQNWYLKQGEGEAGPFSGRELRQLAAAGQLSNDDEIRPASGNNWHKASSVKNLFATASNHTKQQRSVPVDPDTRNSDSILPVVPPESSVVAAPPEAIPTTSEGSRGVVSSNEVADGEEDTKTIPGSQSAANRSELKQQEEALTQELVDLILLDNSSIKDDPAFQELWRENSRLLTRRELLSDLDRKTIRVLPDIEQAENEVADARKLLATKEKNLHGFDTDLGKAAFAALLGGQVADHPRYDRRNELHSRIESLAQQQSELATEPDAKLMDKAKSQAQRLKLAGQIKVSELEIGALNRSIGRSIIEAGEEESVRCEPTDAIIETIQEHRRMITAASETFRDAELNLDDVKSAAAKALGRPGVQESKRLRTELKQNRREVRAIERSITAVRHTVVTKAMEHDELHNDAQLGTALKNLRSIQARIEGIKPGALKFFERQIARWQAGPVGFRYGSIAVATVMLIVIFLALFNFGDESGAWTLGSGDAQPTQDGNSQSSNSIGTTTEGSIGTETTSSAGPNNSTIVNRRPGQFGANTLGAFLESMAFESTVKVKCQQVSSRMNIRDSVDALQEWSKKDSESWEPPKTIDSGVMRGVISMKGMSIFYATAAMSEVVPVAGQKRGELAKTAYSLFKNAAEDLGKQANDAIDTNNKEVYLGTMAFLYSYVYMLSHETDEELEMLANLKSDKASNQLYRVAYVKVKRQMAQPFLSQYRTLLVKRITQTASDRATATMKTAVDDTLLYDHNKSITNSIGMKLNLIPAGKFMMGSPVSQEPLGDNQHEVEITKDFYIGTTEVTQGQWKAVMGTEPCDGKKYVKEGPEYPVCFVSWDDAVRFCKELSKREGKTYRLPTEAEWEYSCRAGTQTTYSFGDSANELGDYGWFSDNAEESAHKVGEKKANRFGLYDMHGNVSEFCADWRDQDYYEKSPRSDPQSPSAGYFRVVRGGSWLSPARDCRSSLRDWFDPSRGNTGIGGFRVARGRLSQVRESGSEGL